MAAVLLMLRGVLGGLWSAAGRVAWYVWVIVVLGALAWHAHGREVALAAQKKAAVEAAEASEDAREIERLSHLVVERISNESQARAVVRVSHAVAVRDRLRVVAAASAASAPATTAACRDAAPAAVISDAARSALVDLASQADEVADNLRTLQEYVTNVCKPRP